MISHRSSSATILLLCLLLPASARAEIGWHLGFKGGLGLGRISGDTVFAEEISDPGVGTLQLSGDPNSLQGDFVAGAFGRAQLSKRFGVQLELLFAQKGSRGDIDLESAGSPFSTGELTYHLHYIEIPLLAVGTFGIGEKSSLDFFAGPSIAFNTSAEFILEYDDEEIDRDLSDDAHGTDFGLTVGTGFNLPGGDDLDLHLDLRYTLGLTDVLESGDSFQNHYIALIAGISFPIREEGADLDL